jgi:hypothetical protein
MFEEYQILGYEHVQGGLKTAGTNSAFIDAGI